jgi:N6-L-threonylcarbamoyladenine synthase
MAGAYILGIESSCDETAASVVYSGEKLVSNVVFSQIAAHQPYGGVVPELASREHLKAIVPVVRKALSDAEQTYQSIDALAVTQGPGLAGALLVGIGYAKALAFALDKPLIAVNHLEGHIHAVLLEERETNNREIAFPVLALVVSGGHTHLYLAEQREQHWSYQNIGHTRDDAAGEAFDKVAKLLGLPYPGGPEIDRLAKNGNPKRFDLPRSMLTSRDFNFSFSGLKTAVRYLLPKLDGDFQADLCASFQEAVTDVLVKKAIRAANSAGMNLLTVSGGVSANSRLRSKMADAAAVAGLELKLTAPSFSTDNAAMIAYAATERYLWGYRSDLSEDADPNLKLGAA